MEEDEEQEVVLTEEDQLIDILAKQSYGDRLTRKEKSLLNKAKWAEKKKALGQVPAKQPIRVPAGAKQRMREFKEQLLKATNGNNVIRKTLEIALNDEHPGQVACLKMCMDRMMPISMFEDAKKGPDKPMISISITGIGESPVTIDNDSGEIDA